MLGQVVLPALARRVLGCEHIVSTARDRSHEGQVPTVATHDLDDEGALVRGRRAGELVNSIQDAMQRSVRTDRHVRAHHVIIDRTDQADNDQRRVGVGKLLRDNALGDQLGDMLRPLVAELVRTRQGTITADDDEVVDTVLEQVRGGAVASLVGTELSAASRADDRATLGEDRGNIRPLHLLNGVAAIACTLPAFKDRIGLRSPGQSRAHHCANGSIHTLGVAARGEDTDTDCAHCSAIFH